MLPQDQTPPRIEIYYGNKPQLPEFGNSYVWQNSYAILRPFDTSSQPNTIRGLTSPRSPGTGEPRDVSLRFFDSVAP